MINLETAKKHFKTVDSLLFDLMEKFGTIDTPIPIEPQLYASELFSSIVSQQLSTKAAATIWKRFSELVGDPTDPNQVKTFSVDELRTVGISNQKANYILAIAHGTTNGTVNLHHLGDLDNEAVIEELIQLKGVGRWTAEMFLIFTLAREDVFSIGDLGLRNAVNRLYSREMNQTEVLEASAKWSPHRTAASLYLWHSLDNKPTG